MLGFPRSGHIIITKKRRNEFLNGRRDYLPHLFKAAYSHCVHFSVESRKPFIIPPLHSQFTHFLRTGGLPIVHSHSKAGSQYNSISSPTGFSPEFC